jgi:hypothetical protein
MQHRLPLLREEAVNMTDEIPIINNPTRVEPVAYRKKEDEHYVLVITNDSTVFLTKRWVSAFEMFGGRITEVEKLVCDIEDICNVSFGIISGRFGFIPADYVVMPYDNVPSCKEDYEEAQERTDYAGKIRQMITPIYDRIVVCVPKDMFAIIKDSLPDGRVIAVTNEIYKDECERRGWTYLPRVGARVGNENRDRILEIIRNL